MKMRDHFFLSEKRSIVYGYLRKNGCSAFKRLILSSLSDNECAGEMSDIARMVQYRSVGIDDVTYDTRLIFVIRDPLERLVSGFLNQFVLKVDNVYPEMFSKAEELIGLPRDRINFDVFVRHYLTSPGFSNVNRHFTPMLFHLTPRVYDNVLFCDELYQDARVVLGEKISEEFFAKPINVTKNFTQYERDDAAVMTARDIRKEFLENRRLPSKQTLMTPDLTVILSDIYGKDIEMFAAYLEERYAHGGAPVALDVKQFM